jgi:cell division protein FtsQ
VAGSGLVLRGARGADALPLVKLEHRGTGERITERRALLALGVLAAAPADLRPRLERTWFDKRGLVVGTDQGPDLIFGGPERARAKWLAAARVLADPKAAGAVYLDLRIPERVAAGGVGPTTAEDTAPPVPTAVPVTPAATAVPTATAIPTATPVATPIATATPIPTATAVPGATTPVPDPQP